MGGLYVTHNNEIVKFIQVTRKGFNLLDIHSNRCILIGRHLYSIALSKSQFIPKDLIHIKAVVVPDWLKLKDYEEIKELK